ncbi:LysR family transcriptional regulator [Shewanella waksmanii]|uniref:LysR family transcriptional regulator n=1 Tax=Shewanella waksmanii TaxID=213783 RepID=UPI003736D40E
MPLKHHFDQLKNCDLNLLIALSVLLKLAHVSKAAAELGLSQSAMSQVLKRLRVMFDDPLLVKSHQGMTLTNKALEISGELAPLLNNVLEIIEGDDFHPATAKGRIRFIMNDASMQLCIEPLLVKMQRLAPSIELEYITQRRDGFQLLRRGQVDLIVGFYDIVPKPLSSEVIGTSPWQLLSLSQPMQKQQNRQTAHLKLLRYQYQEQNQNHLINALKGISAEDASYVLTSGSLATMVQALSCHNTATLLPHYITQVLSEKHAAHTCWLGDAINLDLKLCWNQHSRHSQLHYWFRQVLKQVLIENLSIQGQVK